MASLYRLCLLTLLGVCLILTACKGRTTKADEKQEPYLNVRKSYATVLKVHGAAPQEWREENLLPGVEKVTYPSGNLQLKAWIAMPKNAASGPVPAVVYFHGGF